jgi:hypothetical protein
MEACYQNLTLGALSSRSALSVLVGALFKKFGLFLNTPCILGSFNQQEAFIRSTIKCDTAEVHKFSKNLVATPKL